MPKGEKKKEQSTSEFCLCLWVDQALFFPPFCCLTALPFKNNKHILLSYLKKLSRNLLLTFNFKWWKNQRDWFVIAVIMACMTQLCCPVSVRLKNNLCIVKLMAIWLVCLYLSLSCLSCFEPNSWLLNVFFS